MAHTKQTLRTSLALPTREEVLQALHVSSVQVQHSLAPSTPALSGPRCASICDHVCNASHGHLFAQPVDWRTLQLHDYPQIVPFPMDLATLREYTTSDSFEFSRFLDMSRLIWANSCRYNPPHDRVYAIGLRLAKLFESLVIEAQAHSSDDDPERVTTVYLPLVNALLAMDGFAIFVNPVDCAQELAYPDSIDLPLCLRDIASWLLAVQYCSRHDVEADLVRIAKNALQYNGVVHPVGKMAADFDQVFRRLCAARHDEVDKPHFVSSQMRQQLQENIRNLRPDKILELQKLVLAICADAIDAGAWGARMSIDALSMRQFVQIDVQVRRWLVETELGDNDAGPPTATKKRKCASIA